MSIKYGIVCLTIMTILAGLGHAQKSLPENRPDSLREADKNEIRQHIEAIFQAFIDKDAAKLRATHSSDWVGYSMDARTLRQGLEAYMQGAESSIRNYGMAGFKLTSFDVFFQGDVASVFYIAEVELKNAGATSADKMRALDIYQKRNGKWIQIASHLARHPDALQWRLSQPVKVSEQARKFILDAREQVWRAWFANDRAKLDLFIPDEAVAIDAASKTWQDRAAIMDSAKKFAESGAKLVRLEFPRTEIRVYGNSVTLFTSYIFETETSGQKKITSGTGVETFIQRDGKLINTGWILADEK